MRIASVVVAAGCLLATCGQVFPQESAKREGGKPQLWMMPPSPDPADGRIFRSLFTHPEEWKETRSKIDVFGYADWVMNKQFTDDELRTYLPMLQSWNLKLVLEIGALKPWGPSASKSFPVGEKYWDRIQAMGGKIYGLTMDEPLRVTRTKLNQPDSYAVEETARFIAMVRQKYPGFWIEDTETFPSIPVKDHLAWIDALQARLAALKVRGLDSYRLDVNWIAFTPGKSGGRQAEGSWAEVKEIEDGCHKRHLPFNLIYWASDQPAIQQLGLSDDSTWYTGIFSQGYGYALVGGAPDIYCVQSWLKMPAEAAPENGQWTFTRSVLDFSNKFIPSKSR